MSTYVNEDNRIKYNENKSEIEEQQKRTGASTDNDGLAASLKSDEDPIVKSSDTVANREHQDSCLSVKQHRLDKKQETAILNRRRELNRVHCMRRRQREKESLASLTKQQTEMSSKNLKLIQENRVVKELNRLLQIPHRRDQILKRLEDLNQHGCTGEEVKSGNSSHQLQQPMQPSSAPIFPLPQVLSQHNMDCILPMAQDLANQNQRQLMDANQVAPTEVSPSSGPSSLLHSSSQNHASQPQVQDVSENISNGHQLQCTNNTSQTQSEQHMGQHGYASRVAAAMAPDISRVEHAVGHTLPPYHASRQGVASLSPSNHHHLQHEVSPQPDTNRVTQSVPRQEWYIQGHQTDVNNTSYIPQQVFAAMPIFSHIGQQQDLLSLQSQPLLFLQPVNHFPILSSSQDLMNQSIPTETNIFPGLQQTSQQNLFPRFVQLPNQNLCFLQPQFQEICNQSIYDQHMQNTANVIFQILPNQNVVIGNRNNHQIVQAEGQRRNVTMMTNPRYALNNNGTADDQSRFAGVVNSNLNSPLPAPVAFSLRGTPAVDQNAIGTSGPTLQVDHTQQIPPSANLNDVEAHRT